LRRAREDRAEADTAAFFAADENVLFEHQFADVFETDGTSWSLRFSFAVSLSMSLVTENVLAISPGRFLIPERCQTSRAKIWCGLTKVPSRSIAPMRSPSPSAANQRRIFRRLLPRPAGECAAQSARDDAAEARIALTANLHAGNTVASEEFRQEAGGGSEHCIGNEAKIGFADAVPIDEFFESVEIGRARLKGLNEFWLRRKLRSVGRLDEREFILDLRNDAG